MWPPVRVLCAERVESEKTVTAFPWVVARRGRVGCGEEDQARSRRSGLRGVRAARVAEVGILREGADWPRGVRSAVVQSVGLGSLDLGGMKIRDNEDRSVTSLRGGRISSCMEGGS